MKRSHSPPLITCEVIAALRDPSDIEFVHLQEGLHPSCLSLVKRYPYLYERFTKESEMQETLISEFPDRGLVEHNRPESKP